MRHLRALFALAAVFLTPLYSQDATGRIVGVVTDSTGAVVPKAKITVNNTETKDTRETVSGDDGSFQVLLLPIGNYSLTVEANGFRKVVTAAQRLEINQALRMEVKLEVGATSETVQVEGRPAGVETVNATLGQSVTSRPIVNLPLNGRNVLNLALLQPGVTPTSTRSGSAGTFGVAGSKSDAVTFLLDGGLNNNLLDNGVVYNPNPDTVAEFRILSSNYTAEYGRNGGGILSVVTKSGTNDYHGSLFEFLRNEKLNANPFFNNENGIARPILKRNQFGATAGGPLTIPKIIKGKDRFFFFIGWQSQRQTALVQNPSVAVFTPRELAGDFSLSNSTKTGPDKNVVAFLQANPFFQSNPGLAAQGIIDPARINPVAKSYISNNLIPASPVGRIFPQGSQKVDADELTERLDFAVTQSDRISATLGSSRAPQLNPFTTEGNVPGYPTTTKVNRYYSNLSYTKVITPALLNEARFIAQRVNTFQQAPAVDLPTPDKLGIVGITPDHPTGPTQLRFSSGERVGFSRNGPTTLIDNTFNFIDNLTWTKGRHTLKGGFFYAPYQDNTVYDFFIDGRFRFFGPNGGGSLNDRADFLFGLPDEYTQFPEAPSNIRSHSYATFFQDEWKVRPNLVLTLGIRYEYSAPKYDTQGRSFSLALGQQSQRFVNAPKGLLFPGDPGAPNGANFPDKNDWAPRFGFAYSPSSRTSIRGGFGVFFDILKGEDNLQFNGQAPFFGFADIFFDSFNGPATGNQPFLAQPFASTGTPNSFPSRPPSKNLNFADAGFLPIGGTGVYFVDPHLRTPYTYQYNLSVQHELARGLVAEAAYVGTSIHKGTALVDTNPFLLGTRTHLFDTQAGVQKGSFTSLDTFENVVTGSYNSLQTSLTKRLSDSRIGNTYFTFAYTYGHGIDNATGFREFSSQVPYYNHQAFRGDSDNDLRHRISFSGGWDLPFDRWGGPKLLTKGWSVYPILSYRTGFPLDVVSGLVRDGSNPGPSGDGDPQLVHADLVGSNVALFDPHQTHIISGSTANFYFNPANFAVPKTVAGKFTYGTLGRNAFRGPGATNLDLAIAKVTPLIHERLTSEFRAEFFNVFNHTQFGDPSVDITSGTFGQISTTGVLNDARPRIIQLALRLRF